MYLKRLELQGFKSFADKTVLEFKSGITSVIGPNGSGKSNISDAIRWVLGEQSMKSLRGAKSEDVIFAGTQNRKSLGFAEVSMIIDNSDGKLPIEFAEVTVTRKLYRSGETGYFINKAPCRLKDILELFMDTGIGKDGYSIIGQGKIDEILSNKSEDRRRIFEEAAGIVKYRTRKLESEKKLEQTKLNILRVNDIITELESNIEPLKQQSEKAKKFLDLREELKDIEVGLFIHNINSSKEKLEQIVKDVEILTNQKNETEGKLNDVKEQKDKLKQEVEDITNKIEELQNIGFTSSNKIEKINSDINVAKQKMANNEENKERLYDEIAEVTSKIKELQEEKKQKHDKKESLSSNREKFEKELKEKEEQLNEITKKLSDKELEIEDKKKIVEQSIDKRYEISAEINSQDINFENLEKREKTVKNEIQNIISELDSSRIEKQEISKGFNEIESKRNNLLKQIEEIKNQREESNNKISDFDNKIEKIQYDIRMKDSRLKFLMETEKEKEGYNKTVKSLLLDCEKNAELAKGMHGVLANIINVDQKYEVAIEQSLGFALQNIVTQTEADAKKLVEYLRKNNLGRASFLPISSVRGNRLDKISKKGIDGIIGIASDLVKYDDKYKNIILNLLGRTVIVDNINTAIELSKQNKYSFRIVTLQGDIINPSGAISGGSIAKKTVNILGRSREIEDLQNIIKGLKKQLEEILKAKQEYVNSIADIIQKSEQLESSLKEIDITYATEKQKMLSAEENTEKIEIRKEKLLEEQTRINEQKIENRKLKQEKETELSELVKKIEELNSVIETFSNKNKESQKYIDDLNLDITNLKISVSSFDESNLSIDEMIERINQDIVNNEKSIEDKKKVIGELNTESANLNEDIERYYEDIQKIKEEIENSATNTLELKENRKNKNIQMQKYEDEVSDLFNTIEDLKEQLVKLEVKQNKLDQDIEQIVNTMWDEYEITPNNAEEFKRPRNIAETQKQVNMLKAQIKDLGSINIDSIEEYKKSRERYDFLCEQRLDLENSAAKLRNLITDMTKTMKEQFVQQFKLINKNFNEVFVELFGGGKAELILEDEDNVLECGIDIKAQPTGKKLQNMMLLSGGEKAFTAIALLFAILKINPAPFCILDEIEAALDDVNVYRFADYLKKFSKYTQFLVITHRKGTMEAADTVYGITMEENGISKLLSMKLGQG